MGVMLHGTPGVLHAGLGGHLVVPQGPGPGAVLTSCECIPRHFLTSPAVKAHVVFALSGVLAVFGRTELFYIIAGLIELVGLLLGRCPVHGGVQLQVVGKAVNLDISNVFVGPLPIKLVYLEDFLYQDSGSVMTWVPSIKSTGLIPYRTFR